MPYCASHVKRSKKEISAMSNIRRILVTGDTKFNNYFLAYQKLKELIPERSIIVTGASEGVDLIAEIYADTEGFVHEPYPIDWNTYGKSAAYIRNKELIRMCRHAVIFWDGRDEKTKRLIDSYNERKGKPVVIEYEEKDLVKPHPGRVVHVKKSNYDVYCGRPGILSNPYVMKDKNQRDYVILKFTAHLLRNKDVMEAVLDLKGDEILGCHCAPMLCHCDVIAWLLDNARDELNFMLSQFSQDSQLESPTTEKTVAGERFSRPRMSDFKACGRLYTRGGLLIAEGWDQLIETNKTTLVEIPDTKIVKKNLHLSKKMVEAMKNDDDLVSVIYHTNEIKYTKVMYRKVSFQDDPYKEGYWYVDIRDVENRT
jgi:hypothetical protein